MPHPLEVKLDRLRRSLRRSLVAHGVSRLITVVISVVCLLGTVDFVFRFEDQGIRLMLTGTFLAVLVWACYRWVYRPVATRLERLDLARHVGRRYTELGDDLPGAIEFLHQTEDDPVAGSASLRRAVIAETESKAHKLDFTSIIDRRPVTRSIVLAVIVCLAAGCVFLLDTLSCQITLARLACPMSRVTWPRKHYLHLVEHVDRVARGQPFEVEVVDRGGKLPSRVDIHYRFTGPNGKTTEQAQAMQRAGSTMVARRENVSQPFAYRIEGGDDHSMRWIDVEVVEPPAVESLQAIIFPPQYSGRPNSQSTGQITVLQGSRVELSAQATKPLKSAVLRLEDGRKFACHIDKEGRRFYVDGEKTKGFIPEKSGYYGFELIDREDIHGGTPNRWEIRVVEDQPPEVNLDQPSATSFVTPMAVLPIRVTAQDQLALQRIDLVMESFEDKSSNTANESAKQPSGTADKQDTPTISPGTLIATLFEGPLASAPRDNPSQEERRTVDFRWNLTELALEPGDQFSFYVSATDYQPQTGRSDSRRVVVVRPEALIDRLADRQQAILTELARALNLEQESRREVDSLRKELTDKATSDQSVVDRLRRAELVQREVNHQVLTDHADGVPGQVGRLLADLTNNRLDSPDVERRMEALLVELDRLGRKVIPVVSRELIAGIKTAETRLGSDQVDPGNSKTYQAGSPLARSLQAALAAQNEVIATLERLLGHLTQWNDYRRFHQRWARLLRRQETLAQRTTALDRDLLGRRVEDLPPESAARLSMLTDDQLELARHLDQLLQEMDQSRATLEKRDPLAAETILDALRRSRELGISSQMRSAGTSVEHNRLGQAVTLQKEIIAEMREILDLLSNRREDELARLADHLPEVADQLTQLIRRQKALRERMEQKSAAMKSGENHPLEWKSLARQQATLQATAKRFENRLTQLLAKKPAESLHAAAEQMGQASQAADKAEAEVAVRHAIRAETFLEEAAQRLQQHLRNIQSNVADEQLAKLAASIESLCERQEKVHAKTKEIDQTIQPGSAKTNSQVIGLRRLAIEQRTLEKETTALTDELSDAKVFQHVLGEVANQMTIAAGWLGRQQSDTRTQTAQQAAIDGLKRLAESLKTKTSDNIQPPEPAGQQADQGANQNRQKPPKGAIAQLRLLRMLQQDLFVRTQAWEKRFGNQSPLPPQAQREYKQLSQEQGELADLLFELIQKSQ